MAKLKEILPCAVKCATCPFRDGSPYEYLREHLTESALTEATRICHSTGSNNAINRRTNKPARSCRGARDLQLKMFHDMGVLPEATDAAWTTLLAEINEKR